MECNETDSFMSSAERNETHLFIGSAERKETPLFMVNLFFALSVFGLLLKINVVLFFRPSTKPTNL